jgi:hypothetical protein
MTLSLVLVVSLLSQLILLIGELEARGVPGQAT